MNSVLLLMSMALTIMLTGCDETTQLPTVNLPSSNDTRNELGIHSGILIPDRTDSNNTMPATSIATNVATSSTPSGSCRIHCGVTWSLLPVTILCALVPCRQL